MKFVLANVMEAEQVPGCQGGRALMADWIWIIVPLGKMSWAGSCPSSKLFVPCYSSNWSVGWGDMLKIFLIF